MLYQKEVEDPGPAGLVGFLVGLLVRLIVVHVVKITLDACATCFHTFSSHERRAVVQKATTFLQMSFTDLPRTEVSMSSFSSGNMVSFTDGAPRDSLHKLGYRAILSPTGTCHTFLLICPFAYKKGRYIKYLKTPGYHVASTTTYPTSPATHTPWT